MKKSAGTGVCGAELVSRAHVTGPLGSPDYNARMALTTGTKLGPYEIQSLLGTGGMGEVYLARDTRLLRTVAIKVLPAHLIFGPGPA